MHAASVHPEPGSNSRINCIKITLPSVSIFSSFFLASFTFVWVVFSFRISNEISFALYFFRSLSTSSRFVLLQSLVVQFSMTDSTVLKIYSFVIISQSPSLCQVLFSFFSNFFRTFLSPRNRDSVILPHLLLFVKWFWKSFSKIFWNIFSIKTLDKSILIWYINLR